MFWIDPQSLAERASICIALILSQLVLIVGEEQDFPQTSDFKIVDLYLISNFLINVFVLFENILASCCVNRHWRCCGGRGAKQSRKTDKRVCIPFDNKKGCIISQYQKLNTVLLEDTFNLKI